MEIFFSSKNLWKTKTILLPYHDFNNIENKLFCLTLIIKLIDLPDLHMFAQSVRHLFSINTKRICNRYLLFTSNSQ